MLDLISSVIGVSVAEIFTLPICTIRTNYQTDLNHRNIFSCTKSLYDQHGLKIFYKASASAMASQIISLSTKYTFYHMIKNYRKTDNSDILNNMINGALGGIFSSIISHPFDVIKVFHQQNLNYSEEFKKTGYKLPYRGYSKSFIKTLTLSALLFPTYDFYKTKLNDPILSSIATTFSITFILHPIDYLKVRGISNLELYSHKSFFDYYRGISLSLLRSVPHFTIVMYTTEKIKPLLSNYL